MKFTLSTTVKFYHHKEEIDKLEKLGFEFERSLLFGYHIIGKPTIEINSLEELIQFGKEYGKEGKIIVSNGCIEICDNYK
jgi:ribosome biogenesis SPOUT family RNA methylase Rps3